MTEVSLSAVRETLQLARLQANNLNEDASNLDHLLRLTDEELAETVTLEDIVGVWLATPAYFR